MLRLLNILGSQNFKDNLMSLAVKIDNKTTEVISPKELENKLELLMEKQNKFNNATGTVTFLMKNL